jgi:excisionase family DNA binding protein
MTPSYFHKPALSIREFSEATSLGRTRVFEEIKLGHLHAIKVGRRTLITGEELYRWLHAFQEPVAGSGIGPK